jgi:pilus assembly protein CpaF
MVDARLEDGSRVNAIIPPLALDSPTITIRKFPKKRILVEDLVGYRSLTKPMADFLRLSVLAAKNMVISGGTGSGKTTLLNVMGAFIPDGTRIITIEDSAELRLPQDHVVRLETRPPNIEGKGDVSIRDLVKNSLRMRPNRIIVGECRGGEALDMLQAMNTGHDGSMTTVHANSPVDAVRRLENLVLYAGTDLPLKAIRELIFSAVTMIVQISRFSDGTRKVTSIAELASLYDGEIKLQEIFAFRRTGLSEEGQVEGVFSATGVIPSFVEELRLAGMDVDMAMFVPTSET